MKNTLTFSNLIITFKTFAQRFNGTIEMQYYCTQCMDIMYSLRMLVD